MGGFAVAWHGYPRYTADIDFLIRCDAPNAQRMVDALRQFGFASLGIVAEDLCKPDQILQLGAKPNRIDVITSIAAVSFEEAWQSRVTRSIDGCRRRRCLRASRRARTKRPRSARH